MESTKSAMPTSLPWIETLVGFDTTSRVSNLGLIETARDYLLSEGIDSVLTYDAQRQKANLFASIPDRCGRIAGGTVLSGHTDVVPVDGQPWNTDPFCATVADEKLFGRGTADMKSFIGVALAFVPAMKKAVLTKPLHLALSYDEEVGCFGAHRMLEDLQRRGVELDGCIVGEPTSMRAIVAHKGISIHRCQFRGRAAHASLTPSGVNAIEYAARLICYIREMANSFRAAGPFDNAFDVPFSTAQTGTILGGSACNIVPEQCEFDFEVRTLPSVNHDNLIEKIRQHAHEVLLPEMRREHRDAGILFSTLAAAPGLDAAETAVVTQLVRDLTGDRDTRKVAYATEAGLFQAAGIPAVICGPGDIAQAHKSNEFVTLDQIRRCESFFSSLIAAGEQDNVAADVNSRSLKAN